ncbi:MAG: hypothetical protein AAFZ52_00400 [Bacteroidota bacterium]
MARIDNTQTVNHRMGQPHFQEYGDTFSITITAHDAIPKAKIQLVQERMHVVLAKIECDKLPNKRARKEEIQEKYFQHIEQLLHAKRNQEHPFNNPIAARLVADRIEAYGEKYYHLEAYSVLSNHAHLMVDFSRQCPANWDHCSPPPGYRNLPRVLSMIKGGSAYDINKATGRKGPVWSPGYYDRYIRNQIHFTHTLFYILRNPEKAGLVKNWREHPFTFGNSRLVG